MSYDTVRLAVARILRDNPDLRNVNCRRLIQELIEIKTGKKISPETVPRACRELQNTLKKYLPSPKDERWNLEQEYRERFSI